MRSEELGAHPPTKGRSRLPLPKTDEITNQSWPWLIQNLALLLLTNHFSNVPRVIFVIFLSAVHLFPNEGKESQIDLKQGFQMLPWILTVLNILQMLQASQQLRLNHHYVSVPRHDFFFVL